MLRIRKPGTLGIWLFLAICFAFPVRAQLGKVILVPAGSDADHQLNEINATSDPAQKLKLIDAFAAAHSEPDY